jgi:hypothetical protein
MEIKLRYLAEATVGRRPPRAHSDAKANRFLLRTERMLAESGGSGVSRLSPCTAGRRNATFSAEYVPSPKLSHNVQTVWRSGVDSNCRFRLFDRKRPVPARYSFSITVEGAPEADRRTTGF